MLSLFQYDFVIRGFEAGIIVAVIAPLIGTFLVLRRYSLIADTLAHVSLAGIALGLYLGVSPVLTALGVTVASSVGIERLRTLKRVYGESALSLFLSGGLAVATILLSLGGGFNTNLFNYLFGSILTVTEIDIYVMLALAILVLGLLGAFFKELVYSTFDEESAKVSGIPVGPLNTLLILLAAVTISLSIPIIGVLLIAALIVIPVIAALQFRRSFIATVIYAEIISVFSVISGILVSFYLNLSTGGTIVLIMLAIFLGAMALTHKHP